MPAINKKPILAFITLIVLEVLLPHGAAWAKNFALLIGISEYKNPEYCLEGPEYDVKAMQQLLKQQGFDRIIVLLNAQATKANIIDKIHSIQKTSLPGDNVVIYFSGHGTSRYDTNAGIPLPHNSGALVPYEFVYSENDSVNAVMGRLIVGQTDLTPALKDLDNRGANVLALFDACYSGKTIRSIRNFGAGSNRHVDIDFKSLNGNRLLDDEDIGEFKGSIDDYPYNNIFYISASSEFEMARDINSKDIDNKKIPTFNREPHGVLTDAVLKAISGQEKADLNNDRSITMEELYQSVRKTIKDKLEFIQTPQYLPITGPNADKLRNLAFFNAVPQTAQIYQSSDDIKVQVDDQLKNIKKYIHDAKDLTLSNSNPDLRILLDSGRIVLTLADYRQISIFKEPIPELIIQKVRQYAMVLPLIKLSYPCQGHNVAIRLENKLFRTIFKPDEVIGFSIESEKRAYLLLICVNPEGRINVIYPYCPEELTPQPAKRALTLPNLFKIEPPCGTDTVKVFAFTKKPQELEAIMGKENIAPGSEDYLTLCRMVFNNASTRVDVAQDTITVTSYDKEDFSDLQ